MRDIFADKKYLALLLLFTVAGLVLRVGWVLGVPTVPVFDFATYLELASNIFHGQGHTLNGNPVAWQGPFYPYALALFHGIMGNDATINAKIFNLLLSAATLGMAFFLYAKWFAGRPGKIMAAYGITALFPHLIAYNNVAGNETLFLFLLVGLLLLQLYLPPVLWKYPLIGLLCGVAALTKPFMLAYPVVLAVIWWAQGKRLKETLAATALVFATLLLVLSPWAVRNYRVFGEFILVSYNRGYVQFISNNDANTHGGWMDPLNAPLSPEKRAQIESSLAFGRSIKEAYELEPLFAQAAQEWMWQNPVAFLELSVLRVQRTFFNGAGDISQWAMNDVDWNDAPTRRTIAMWEGLFSILVSVFSVAGLLFGLRMLWPFLRGVLRREKAAHCLPDTEKAVFIHIAFFVAIAAFFEGQERYIFPVIPFLVFALLWFWDRKHVQ